MTVAVITDSAATIPDEMAADLGITVVPLRLAIGTDPYRDGEVDPELLLSRGEEITTSGPTPADFLDAIGSNDCNEALVATVSHDMSEATFLAARSAAELAPVPTRVLDTKTAAGGQGLVVIEAARVASGDATLDQVEATAHRVADRIRLVATLPNLDHLVRSGHVPGAAAWAARWAGLRPIIQLRQGKASPLAPALSEKAAYRRVLDFWRRSKPETNRPLHIAALHSMAETQAQELLAVVRLEVEPVTAFLGSFGTAMLVHSGPGVVGLAWWWG